MILCARIALRSSLLTVSQETDPPGPPLPDRFLKSSPAWNDGRSRREPTVMLRSSGRELSRQRLRIWQDFPSQTFETHAFKNTASSQSKSQSIVWKVL